MSRYSPWAELASLPGIQVLYEEIEDCWGFYDHATETIHLDSRLNQAERRCTLTHELIHAHGRDKAEHVTPAVERRVENEAARRLIPLDALADILRWAPNEHVVADALWVDVDTVRNRLDGLTAEERTYISERQDRHLGEIA